MKHLSLYLCAVVVTAASALPALADDLFTQAPFYGGTAYASDSAFTSYAEFTLQNNSSITGIDWSGVHSVSGGSPSGFTISFYSNVVLPTDGAFAAPELPGSLLYTEHIGGNGNESFVLSYYTLKFTGGIDAVYDVDNYSAQVDFLAADGVPYWVSVRVDDIPEQRNWFWGTSDIGYGLSRGGDLLLLGHGLAYTLEGNVLAPPPPSAPPAATPEPGSLVLTGTGLLAFAGVVRRRLFRR